MICRIGKKKRNIELIFNFLVKEWYFKGYNFTNTIKKKKKKY